MITEKNELASRIVHAVKKRHDELSSEDLREFAFHMTDWIDDLQRLISAYEADIEISDDQIYEILLKFCIHAPLHIVRASEILLDDKFSLLYEDYMTASNK
jgi:hypothetical protein